MGLKKEAEMGWGGEAVEVVWFGEKRGAEGVGGTIDRAGWALWAVFGPDASRGTSEDWSVCLML